MCGIVGLVQRFDPDARFDAAALTEALRALEAWRIDAPDAADALMAAARALEGPSLRLVGWAGFRALREASALRADARRAADLLRAAAQAVDERLADTRAPVGSAVGEALSRGAVAARDVAWRLVEDALSNVDAAEALRPTGEDPGLKGWFELWRLNLVLNQLARLEVRGRDSGGLATLVVLDAGAWTGARAVLEARGLLGELERRAATPHLRDLAVLRAPTPGGGVALLLAHKVAREVGELGANVRDLRARLAADALHRVLISLPGARVQALAHTRWASNGIISEPNCHPVANDLPGRPLERIVAAVLNGDVDNYVALAAGWPIPAEVTTDAKVIPLEVSRRLGADPARAFCDAVASFTGSTAIAALLGDDPDRVHLALRGSGQALYVGVTEEQGYLFASELYGVVEAAARFHKLDGDQGEVVRLRALAPGEDALAGLERAGYDGAPRPAPKLKPAPIATRDIDRAGFSHFLLKEISQAPTSIERTLRGKFVVDAPDRGRFLLGDDVVPPAVREALAARALRRVYVIGQGTAAVAGQAAAEYMAALLRPAGIDVRGLTASDLSGFYLSDVGPDVLIVAVSQSGTTTDTNRTVDLARERGAPVLAIVNRRGSDLADKAHGVLYTSDGRDVEMSVASTKAFYCQVVAGYLLGLQLAALAGALEPADLAGRLLRLMDLPRCLRVVLEESRDRLRQAASLALERRHWTVVGSGPMLHAAREIRIKLSELCYKSVAVDTIEDKKHIDLSSEPLILVCAAGLTGAAAADAVKEVATYRAHAARPVVICDRGERRFGEYAEATVEVPATSTELALLLNTMAGHLFSFEVARAIDRLTEPLRQVRELAEAAHESIVVADDHASSVEAQEALARARQALRPAATSVFRAIDEGLWNAAVGPGTTLRLTTALRVALGHVPWQEVRPGQPFPSPRGMLEHLLAEVARAVDALRRPIDAIKHQAKTVTVGISREAVARPEPGPLLRALEEVGLAAARVSDQDAAALAALEPVIERVAGAVSYRLEELDPLGAPTDLSRIVVVEKSGVAAAMTSRADAGAPLAGTKRQIVRAPRVWVGLGQRDGQPLVACPGYDEGVVRGLGLLHVAFKVGASTRERVRALRAAGRYEDLKCAVTEHDVPWGDALLDAVPVAALLTAPLEALARELAGRGDGAFMGVGASEADA
ncbi:MAG: SIS domain-containing protein [Planctomycetes bacterium]|nr:SIS domain-containing protein [Planctomycetota bacterium]